VGGHTRRIKANVWLAPVCLLVFCALATVVHAQIVSPAAVGPDRRGYTQTSVQSGGSDLTRDNGFNAGVEVKPLHYLDLEANFSRSVPLALNIFSFGLSVDIGAAFRSRSTL